MKKMLIVLLPFLALNVNAEDFIPSSVPKNGDVAKFCEYQGEWARMMFDARQEGKSKSLVEEVLSKMDAPVLTKYEFEFTKDMAYGHPIYKYNAESYKEMFADMIETKCIERYNYIF